MIGFAILIVCGALLLFYLNSKHEKQSHDRRLEKIQKRLAEIEKEKKAGNVDDTDDTH